MANKNEIVINIWDDYLEGKPTTMYVETDRITRLTTAKILRKIRYHVVKAGGMKRVAFCSNGNGTKGRFNKTLNFVRGTDYPFIRLEGLKDSQKLAEDLNKKDLTYRMKALRFISES